MEPQIEVTTGVRLLAAHDAGNADEVVAIITRAPLEAWFGVPPDQMREILRAIPPDSIPAGSAVRAFRLFLNGPVVAHSTTDLDPSEMAASFFDARARGEARDAADVMRRASESPRMNALFDETAGMATFQAVQLGLSQMLTGDLAEALASFTLARRTPPPAPLTALLRDAYVKPALVHALHGDPRTARRKLALAAELPRTSSWVEHVIDAHAALAAAAVAGDGCLDDAVEQVERIPVPLLGELWPYRVDVLFRLHLRRGRLDEAEASVARFQPAASGFVPGQGVPGSVFAAAHATAALLRGDVPQARVLLSGIDERPAIYRVLREAVAVGSGDSAEAIRRLIGLHAQTSPLRQLEFLRVTLLSAALLGQGLVYVDATGSDPAWTVVADPVAPDGTTTVTATLTGDLAPATDAPTLSLTVTVTAAAYDEVINVGVVSADQPETDPTDNTSDDTVTVPPQSTLVVTKTALGGLQVGSKGTYVIAVTNDGPTEDPGPIVVTDVLPRGLTFVSATSASASCDASGQTVTCTVTGPLGVGETASITLVVKVGNAAYPEVTNTVTVTTPTEQLLGSSLTASTTNPVAADPLAGTGGSLPWWLIMATLLLLIAGGGFLAASRRQTGV